jgi:hypothetical protein
MKDKKLTFKILLVIFLLISSFLSYNKEYFMSNKDLFDGSIKIIKNKLYHDYPSLFNYSVELLNRIPNSLESKYLMDEYIFNLFDKNLTTSFNPIYEKFDLGNIKTLGDVNHHTIPKLLITLLLIAGIEKPHEGKCTHEFEENSRKGEKFFNDILLNCNNNNYKALIHYVNIIFFNYSDDITSNKINQFHKNFPDHIFIPFLELILLGRQEINTNEFEKVINKAIENFKKYENIKTPLGYKLIDECYFIIAYKYFDNHNINKTNEYIKILKNDNYNSEKIKELELKVASLKKR